MNEGEVAMYHKKRTANANEYKNYIAAFSKKSGIKNFKNINN